MKICLVSTDYPSKGRPTYVFVEQLVHQLLKKEIEVTVIAPQSLTFALVHRKPLRLMVNNVKSPDSIEYTVYRPYYLSAGEKCPKLTRIFDYFRSNSIESIIKKEEPDVLYAHFWENAAIIDGIARKLQKPLFVACGEGDNAIEKMIDRLSDVRKKELATTVTGIISVSSENKRKCLSFGLGRKDNIIVLPNCVDTKELKYDKSLAIRNVLGIKDDDFVIAFCGAFINRKGSKRLSDAIKKLNDSKIKSIFIGKPYDGENETPDCEGIVFMGSIEHEELPKYLNSADLFVLPTQKEGCCNAIVEALACGLPVVSSDGAFNDDILNEENSIRVNPDNVDEIATAIRRFVDNSDMRMAMKKQIISHHSQYSLSSRASKIKEFIETKSSNIEK